MVLGKAGHFQFLDSQSMLQRTICAVGPIQDASVRSAAQVMQLQLFSDLKGLVLVFCCNLSNVQGVDFQC